MALQLKVKRCSARLGLNVGLERSELYANTGVRAVNPILQPIVGN